MGEKRIVEIFFSPTFLYFCGMKYLLLVVGGFSVFLGVIGIFLPVLPTTPFLLLAAALFFRSSPRAYDWLMVHPQLGPYIRSFREEKAIPMRVKVISVSLMWLTALHCIIFVFNYWWLKGLMALLSLGITWYILSLKTKRKS